MSDTNALTEKEKLEKGIIIDPANLKNAPRGEKQKMDLDEDAWAASILPPHDRYSCRPALAKNGIVWKPKSDKNAVAFYSVNMELRIVSDNLDVHNYPAFYTVTTKLGRGKKISTAVGFIKKLGFKPADELDDATQVELLVECLKKEKLIVAEIDWRASFLDPDGKWKNVCSTMADFPKDEEEAGLYRNVLRVTNSKGTAEEVKAKLTIVKVWSKKEFKEAGDKGELQAIGKASSPKAVNTAQMVEEEDEAPATAVKKPKGESETVKAVKGSKKVVEPEPEEVSEEAMALALEEDE